MASAFFMDKDDKEMAKELGTEISKGLVIGDRVYFAPVNQDGRPFYFNALQTRFLFFLQKNNGNVQKACSMVDQPLEWAQKFFTSRKWREYRDHLLASSAVRNGNIKNWWWQYALDGMKGYREWYEYECGLCHDRQELSVAKAEMYRNDDMKFDAKCLLCQTDVELIYKQEPFKPTREQVQFFAEVGARIEPKVERRIHESSEETFVFVPEGDAA